MRGVVHAAPDFIGHTQVIDGASEMFVNVFGDAGRPARLAVGVSSLPRRGAVAARNDPLAEYQREGYDMFLLMIDCLQGDCIRSLFRNAP